MPKDPKKRSTTTTNTNSSSNSRNVSRKDVAKALAFFGLALAWRSIATANVNNNITMNTTTLQVRPLPLRPLNFCNESFFHRDKKHKTFPIEYQCNGPHYENFTSRLLEYANNATLHTATWGRRPIPLPANQTVLFLGNSHLRQVIKELICHFGDQIVTLQTPNR